jgi:putative transposase
MKGEHPIRWLCGILEVSPSGYYRWAKRQPSAREREDAVLEQEILASHRKSRCTYGVPRILEDLRERGHWISKRRCSRLMRTLEVRGRKRHRRKPRTTDSGHGRPTPPNRRLQQEPPSGPNQVWATDLTAIQTSEGWLYLAVILDLWSRKVVGWACAPTMVAGLVVLALQRALQNRGHPKDLLHHSDQGSQYVDEDYLRLLAKHGILRSMSRRGNCYDNAEIESFWSTLKCDTGLDHHVFLSQSQTELAVFDYIETFYNPARRHSSLGQLSPVAFENLKN